MAKIGFECGFQYPDAVHFIACVLGAHVAGQDQILVLELAVVQTVGVIRNHHAAFAHNLPVIAFGRTVKQAVFVDGAKTAGGGVGRIKTKGRVLAHAARARVITKSHAWLGFAVEVVSRHKIGARIAQRQHGGDIGPCVNAAHRAFGLVAGVTVLVQDLVVLPAPSDFVARINHSHIVNRTLAGAHGVDHIGGQFQPCFGKGEKGQTCAHASNPQAVIDQLGGFGVF